MTNFYLLTHVRFAPGALNDLPQELARLGVRNPLIVTDPGLARLGLADRAAALISKASIFADTPENPTEAAVDAALAIFSANGCDGIVAIGGGSAMDLGKALGVMATHPGRLIDYDVTQPSFKPVGAITPLVVVPTTAGTGTEVGVGCVIILDNGHKGIIDGFGLIPASVICDPELTVSLPARLTAATGMDALSHCIEGVFSSLDNPLVEAIALDGTRRIVGAIERACSHPDDLSARAEMMWGSLAGGYAMLMELGAIHGLSVPIGALHHAHHGALTAAVMGNVTRLNATLAPQKAARLRQAMSLPEGQDLGDFLNGLCDRLGLSRRLRDFGLQQSEFAGLAAEAEASGFNITNPKPLPAEAYLRLLEESW
jgi:alcohol dehydrogenase class IV